MNTTTYPPPKTVDDVRINDALIFATNAHKGQFRKGTPNLPYIFHPYGVAREVTLYSGIRNTGTLTNAIIVALLHDVIEDTSVVAPEITHAFGETIAAGVQALSKDERIVEESSISRIAGLRENLERIKKAPHWVWCVKLADRMDNLFAFPAFWRQEKIETYLKESRFIADTLGSASAGLHARLVNRIKSVQTTLGITY